MAKSTFASVYRPKMPRRGFHSVGRAPALEKAARQAAAVADSSKVRRLIFWFGIGFFRRGGPPSVGNHKEARIGSERGVASRGNQRGASNARLRACPLRRAQKRKGDFSREISPSLFRFSEIRFGFQITTLVIPESLGTHELQPAFTSLFYDHTRCKSLPTAIRLQLPGPSLVADSRRRLLVRSLLLEDHSSSESNSTLHQREC
jgi:hypothetical protein